jgi:NAD(P)-dependent dehydrogenase (short-subunit alcohol dehydrogenase family)
MGRRAVPFALDVRDQASIEAMATATFAAFPQVHILVNNAGCNVRKPALEVSWDDWNLILDTNLRGTFLSLRRSPGTWSSIATVASSTSAR